MKKLIFLAILSFLVSCATAHQVPPPLDSKTQKDTKSKLVLPSLSSESPLNRNLEADRFTDYASVQKWIVYFSTQGKSRFETVLKRGSLYKKQIHSILQKFELPTHLYYLALIESDFKVDARSPAQATGIWQFMPPTARNYGLRINQFIDERRDPWRSTVAAALYLKNLKNVFDSWFLAMSAYNAGESRIMNAIIRSGTRDFWQLSKIGFIPRETREYVPRFLAAVIVGEHPEKYGLNIDFPDQPTVLAVRVPSPVHLETLAQKAGLSIEELRTYNPHFLKNFTPPQPDSYRIWLPQGKNYNLDALAQLEVVPLSKIQAAIAPHHKLPAKKHKRSKHSK